MEEPKHQHEIHGLTFQRAQISIHMDGTVYRLIVKHHKGTMIFAIGIIIFQGKLNITWRGGPTLQYATEVVA